MISEVSVAMSVWCHWLIRCVYICQMFCFYNILHQEVMMHGDGNSISWQSEGRYWTSTDKQFPLFLIQMSSGESSMQLMVL